MKTKIFLAAMKRILNKDSNSFAIIPESKQELVMKILFTYSVEANIGSLIISLNQTNLLETYWKVKCPLI
jgi:primosomal protein N'